MTSGVTRALPAPDSGATMLDNIQLEVVRAVQNEGPRFLDRHSTNAETTYRNSRFRKLADLQGLQKYATDAKGRRVRTGMTPEGDVTVGLGFNMDADDARKDWKNVFGDEVSFDEVRSGKRPLSTTEIQALFDYSVLPLEKSISDAVGDYVLAENQRMALVYASMANPMLLPTVAPMLQQGDFLGVQDVLLHGNGQPTHRAYAQARMFATDMGESLPDYDSYRAGWGKSGDLQQSIVATANKLGIDPLDLATVISYETGGTMDPWKKGPRTKWGTHRGLIQWGEPQQRQYGVYKGMPVSEQMNAVGRYLVNAGVKPGMGILDIYSAINAGRVGKYGASDRPGYTVRSHVAGMNQTHRPRMARWLQG
jgi:hypothetical protein